MTQFQYLNNGEVWALEPNAPHTLCTSAGVRLAVYPGTHAGNLVEYAVTARYCYPAGDGWVRHGECLDENGIECWRWRRDWMLVMPSAGRNGNGKRGNGGAR